MSQAPHQLVENVVEQQPQAKVGDHRLHHPRMSLRETLSLCFLSEFSKHVLKQERE